MHELQGEKTLLTLAEGPWKAEVITPAPPLHSTLVCIVGTFGQYGAFTIVVSPEIEKNIRSVATH